MNICYLSKPVWKRCDGVSRFGSNELFSVTNSIWNFLFSFEQVLSSQSFSNSFLRHETSKLRQKHRGNAENINYRLIWGNFFRNSKTKMHLFTALLLCSLALPFGWSRFANQLSLLFVNKQMDKSTKIIYFFETNKFQFFPTSRKSWNLIMQHVKCGPFCTNLCRSPFMTQYLYIT